VTKDKEREREREREREVFFGGRVSTLLTGAGCFWYSYEKTSTLSVSQKTKPFL